MPIGAYRPVGDKAQGGCRPGAEALHRYIIDRWGDGVGSFGCYNPNSRAGNGWSLHREGRAIDVSIRQGYQNKGDDIFHWAIRNADSLGLQEIQWAGQIWTSRRSQEGIRPDTSPAGKLHYDHVHIGLAEGWTFTPPGDTPSTPPPPAPSPEEDDLTEDERRMLKEVHGAITAGPLSMQNVVNDTWGRVIKLQEMFTAGPLSLKPLIENTWGRLVKSKTGD